MKVLTSGLGLVCAIYMQFLYLYLVISSVEMGELTLNIVHHNKLICITSLSNICNIPTPENTATGT